MTVVAVTQRLMREERYDEVRDALDIQWVRLLEACGIVPLVLSSAQDFRKCFSVVPVQGIFLTGGNSLSSLVPDALSVQRDAFEKELLTYACEKGIPVLGACRGMQVIAEYFGAEIVPVSGHVRVRHHLKASGEGEIVLNGRDVNSFHDYGIRAVSSPLRPIAWAEDGVVEALVHEKLPIYAQMWHPERERPFDPQDIQMIKNFFGHRRTV